MRSSLALERDSLSGGKTPGRVVMTDLNYDSCSARGIEMNEFSVSREGERRNVDVWVTQSSKYEGQKSELPCPVGKLSGDKVEFLHTQDMQPAKMLNGSSQSDDLVILDRNHQSFSIEVQQIAPSGKVEKPSSEQWSNRTRTKVLRSEQPSSGEIRSIDKVQFSHTQMGAENLHSVSPGKIVLPYPNQHSFSIRVQERSPGFQIEKRNAQQWVTQTTSYVEPLSQVPHASNRLPPAGKLQFHSTNNTEPANSLNGSSPGRIVIHDFNQDSSSIQVQEVVPPPTVKKSDTEEWKMQIRTLEELQSEAPGTVQLLHTYKTQPINTSDDVSAARANVAPGGYQHSFSIQRQDGKRYGEQLITQQSTTKFPVGETQFVHSDETQVITLDGSSGGSVVIPIQIDHISSPPNVEIRRA